MVLKSVFLVKFEKCLVFELFGNSFENKKLSIKKISSTPHFSLQRMKTNQTLSSSELYSCIRLWVRFLIF